MALSGGRIEENDPRVGLLCRVTPAVVREVFRTGDCHPRVKGRTDHHVWKSLVGNKEMHGGRLRVDPVSPS